MNPGQNSDDAKTDTRAETLRQDEEALTNSMLLSYFE